MLILVSYCGKYGPIPLTVLLYTLLSSFSWSRSTSFVATMCECPLARLPCLGPLTRILLRVRRAVWQRYCKIVERCVYMLVNDGAVVPAGHWCRHPVDSACMCMVKAHTPGDVLLVVEQQQTSSLLTCRCFAVSLRLDRAITLTSCRTFEMRTELRWAMPCHVRSFCASQPHVCTDMPMAC